MVSAMRFRGFLKVMGFMLTSWENLEYWSRTHVVCAAPHTCIINVEVSMRASSLWPLTTKFVVMSNQTAMTSWCKQVLLPENMQNDTIPLCLSCYWIDCSLTPHVTYVSQLILVDDKRRLRTSNVCNSQHRQPSFHTVRSPPT